MPAGYYALITPALLKQDRNTLSPLRRAELDKFGAACRTQPELRGMVQTLFDAMLPRGKAESTTGESLEALLQEYGFDRAQHEHIRGDLKDGRIGLAQNRLPTSATIEDVSHEDFFDYEAYRKQQAELTAKQDRPRPSGFERYHTLGFEALANGEVAVVTLAAGAGDAR